MSSATVATIACLALVGAAGMAVWVALQQRRTDELARALTARKWDIVTLRAELGALRQHVRGEGPGSATPVARPGDDAAERPVVPPGDGHEGRDGGDAAFEPRSPGGFSRATAGPVPSPTAWRRERTRGASSRPRRRRLF